MHAERMQIEKQELDRPRWLFLICLEERYFVKGRHRDECSYVLWYLRFLLPAVRRVV
jgi:hypothetical protein